MTATINDDTWYKILMLRGSWRRRKQCRSSYTNNSWDLTDYMQGDIIKNIHSFFKKQVLKHLSFFRTSKSIIWKSGFFPSTLVIEITLKYINKRLILESPSIRLCGLNL